MPLSKEKRLNPTQKHLNSHCYIMYRKTLKNVIRSHEKKALSVKKTQPNFHQFLQTQSKTNLNLKNGDVQKTTPVQKHNDLFKQKNYCQTLKFYIKNQRTKSQQKGKTKKWFYFKHSGKTDSNQQTKLKFRSSTKASTQNQNETTVIQELKEETQFYRGKCFQSQEKLGKLSKKLHEQKKIHEAQRAIYEQRIKKLRNMILLTQKQRDNVFHEINCQIKRSGPKKCPKACTFQQSILLSCNEQQQENNIDLQLQSRIVKISGKQNHC